MQAGKVDIPSSCIICGANLSDRGVKTCSIDCRRVLRNRVKALNEARRELVEAAYLLTPAGRCSEVAYLDAVAALEKCAVVYTVRAKAAGRLP